MLRFSKFLSATIFTLSINQYTLASEPEEFDNSSLAFSAETPAATTDVVVVDVRGLASDQVPVKIHDAILQIAREKNTSRHLNRASSDDKSLKIVYDTKTGESHSTLLPLAELTKYVERADLKKYLAAETLSAETGIMGFKKVLELSGYKLKNNFAERLTGLATACFVGVTKEIYESRFSANRSVDKKDALTSCADGAGILLKVEFKF